MFEFIEVGFVYLYVKLGQTSCLRTVSNSQTLWDGSRLALFKGPTASYSNGCFAFDLLYVAQNLSSILSTLVTTRHPSWSICGMLLSSTDYRIEERLDYLSIHNNSPWKMEKKPPICRVRGSSVRLPRGTYGGCLHRDIGFLIRTQGQSGLPRHCVAVNLPNPSS
jgi:hypothetical protein